MVGHIEEVEDTRPKSYQMVFYGKIRRKDGHWTSDQCEEVRLSFVAFLESQEALYVEDPQVIWITPAG